MKSFHLDRETWIILNIWIKLSGSNYLDQIIWIKLSASNCLDQIIWIKLSRSNYLDQIIWIKLSGSNYLIEISIFIFYQYFWSNSKFKQIFQIYFMDPQFSHSMDPEKFLAIKKCKGGVRTSIQNHKKAARLNRRLKKYKSNKRWFQHLLFLNNLTTLNSHTVPTISRERFLYYC